LDENVLAVAAFPCLAADGFPMLSPIIRLVGGDANQFRREQAFVANDAEFKVLDEAELADALMDLPGWDLKGIQIFKQYVFTSFRDAIDFVNRAADIAEELNHHPDIHITYKKVKVYCWTHKFNAITRADVKLASRLDAAFEG